jgi:hypothetical protein
MVVANDALIDRALQYAAKREKGDPTAESELVDISLSRNAVKSFVESLTRHVAVSIRW